MCMSTPKVPKFEPPPTVPQPVDADVLQDVEERRMRARRTRGTASTVLTSGLTEVQPRRASLLGGT